MVLLLALIATLNDAIRGLSGAADGLDITVEALQEALLFANTFRNGSFMFGVLDHLLISKRGLLIATTICALSMMPVIFAI